MKKVIYILFFAMLFFTANCYLFNLYDEDDFSKNDLNDELDQQVTQDWRWIYQTDVNTCINVHSTYDYDAYNPKLIVFNNKLYAAWVETNYSNYFIITAVYNEQDNTPDWTYVMGEDYRPDCITNFDAKQTEFINLAVYNNELYITWDPLNSSNYRIIKAAKYNGNDSDPGWQEIDSFVGLNRNLNNHAHYPYLNGDTNNLYLVWSEIEYGGYHIKASSYNTSDYWQDIKNYMRYDEDKDGTDDDSLNVRLDRIAENPYLITFKNELYALWSENNYNGVSQIRVASYNPDATIDERSWDFVDSNSAEMGINKSISRMAYHPQAVADENYLYVTWKEQIETDHYPSAYQVRVAAYDGNKWQFIDGNQDQGINFAEASSPNLTLLNNKLYVTFIDKLGSDYYMRVCFYENEQWHFFDEKDGFIKKRTKMTENPQIISFNNKLHLIWQENDKIHTAVYTDQ